MNLIQLQPKWLNILIQFNLNQNGWTHFPRKYSSLNSWFFEAGKRGNTADDHNDDLGLNDDLDLDDDDDDDLDLDDHHHHNDDNDDDDGDDDDDDDDV